MLYKQRFFSELLPTLLRGFHEASAPSKPAHLLAISYLLKHIPKSVLLSELHTVLPHDPMFSPTGASHGCFEAPIADPLLRLRLSGR